MANGRVEGSFIGDEEFDFDLPVSPGSPHSRDLECEDEDEVFFGPVGYKETCVSVNTENTAALLNEDESVKPLSPLNSEQVVELFKEATAVAVMLRNSQGDSSPQATNKKKFENIRRRVNGEQFKNDENSQPSEIKMGTSDGINSAPHCNIESMNIDNENKGKEFLAGVKIIKENTRNVLGENNTSKGKILTKSKDTASKLRKTGIQKPSLLKGSKLPSTTKSKKLSSESRSDDITSSLNKSCKKSHSEMPTSVQRQSSSASDTSFSEEKESKFSKLPIPGHSSLMIPGSLVGRRRRTSSTSSVSSTSSTSSLPSNLNETFVISRDPSSTVGAPTVRRSSANSSKDAGSFIKPLITKSNLKPLAFNKSAFSRHSEADKIKAKNKLQPMKAFHKPVIVKASTTPKKSSEATPIYGTPPRRGGNLVRNASNVGTPSKSKNSLVVSSSKVKPRGSGETPVKKRESCAFLSRGTKATGDVNMHTPTKGRTHSKSGLSTPSNNHITTAGTMQETPGVGTPPKSDSEHVTRKAQTESCKKRRSFLPTPSRTGQGQARHKSTGLLHSSSFSPVTFHLSPKHKMKKYSENSKSKKINKDCEDIIVSCDDVSQTLEGTFVKESDSELSESSETGGGQKALECPIAEAAQSDGDGFIAKPVNVENEIPQSEAEGPLLSGVTSSCAGKAEMVSTRIASHASPLLLMLSPKEKSDPFSPGNISPNLPQEASMGCPTLLPTVLSVPEKDLMLHTTPVTKVEMNLIELSDSPMIDVIKKCKSNTLVEI